MGEGALREQLLAAGYVQKDDESDLSDEYDEYSDDDDIDIDEVKLIDISQSPVLVIVWSFLFIWIFSSLQVQYNRSNYFNPSIRNTGAINVA